MEIDALNYVWRNRYSVVANIEASQYPEYKKKYGPFDETDIILGFKYKTKWPIHINNYIVKLPPVYEYVWHCRYIPDNKYVGITKEVCEANARLIGVAENQSWTHHLSKPKTTNKYMGKWFNNYQSDPEDDLNDLDGTESSYEVMMTGEA